MYIHRVILKGVEGVPDRDLTFFDSWTNQPLHNVLLTGPNGSGKTTILRVIADVSWTTLERVLSVTGQVTYSSISGPTPLKANFDLVAVEIRNFIGEPLWFYSSSADAITLERWKNEFGIQGEHFGQSPTKEHLGNSFVDDVSFVWKDILQTRLARLKLGAGSPDDLLPNMIFMEAENRQIGQSTNGIIQSEPLYRWLIVLGQVSYNESLENQLRNLKVRDSAWFYRVLEDINLFLQQNGKHLTDFDDNLRLKVEPLNGSGSRHNLEDLSSGERQCIILIFTVSRWLMEGGVVLIDEPDLHIHGSWQRSLIHNLQQIVMKKHGQLIITSHSEILAEEYPESSRFHLEAEPLKQ